MSRETDRNEDGLAFARTLPSWAVIGDHRKAHIERVHALLDRWARAMALSESDAKAWRDAGLLHDALRDADEGSLRASTAMPDWDVGMLHGPAAAARLVADGESRADVIDAIRWHTVGCPSWGRVGRALYMADFLDPGRSSAQADRAFLANQVPQDFDGVFRQVVRLRLEWLLREGRLLPAASVALWHTVR